MTMRIETLSVQNYSFAEPKGSFVLTDEETTLNIKLSSEDAIRIMNLCIDIFQSRQKAIAESVAKMQPNLLMAPIPEGDYEVVIDSNDNDGIPF